MRPDRVAKESVGVKPEFGLGGALVPNSETKINLGPSLLDEWCARDEILKRVRKLRWIGRADEAEALIRTIRQNDGVGRDIRVG